MFLATKQPVIKGETMAELPIKYLRNEVPQIIISQLRTYLILLIKQYSCETLIARRSKVSIF